MTPDPLAFLREALDRAQARAEAAAMRAWSGDWEYDHMVHEIRDLSNGNELAHDVYFPEIGHHIEATNPAAVLRRIAADRKILELHTTPHTVVDGFCVEEDGACTHRGEDDCVICGQQPCETLCALAEGYGWAEDMTMACSVCGAVVPWNPFTTCSWACFDTETRDGAPEALAYFMGLGAPEGPIGDPE